MLGTDQQLGGREPTPSAIETGVGGHGACACQRLDLTSLLEHGEHPLGALPIHRRNLQRPRDKNSCPRASGAGTFDGMATRPQLDPALQRTVERARAAARERGELLDGASGISGHDLSPAARAALADWVASGDYDRIVAEVTAGDPDIATLQ